MPSATPAAACLAIDYGHYSVKSSHFTASLGSSSTSNNAKSGRRKQPRSSTATTTTNNNEGAANTNNKGDTANGGAEANFVVDEDAVLDTVAQANAWGVDPTSGAYCFDQERFINTISDLLVRHGFASASDTNGAAASSVPVDQLPKSTNATAVCDILSLHIPIELSPHERELILHCLFENFTFKNLHLSYSPITPLFSVGVTSGIVVDLGEAAGRIVPVREGSLLSSSWMTHVTAASSQAGCSAPPSYSPCGGGVGGGSFLGGGVGIVSSRTLGGQYLSQLTSELLALRNSSQMVPSSSSSQQQQTPYFVHFRDLDAIKSQLFSTRYDIWDFLSSPATTSSQAMTTPTTTRVKCTHTLPDGQDALELELDSRDCVLLPSLLIHPMSWVNPLVASTTPSFSSAWSRLRELEQNADEALGLCDALLYSVRQCTVLHPLLHEASSSSLPAVVPPQQQPNNSGGGGKKVRGGILFCGGTSLTPGLLDAVHAGLVQCSSSSSTTHHHHHHPPKRSDGRVTSLPMFLPNSPVEELPSSSQQQDQTTRRARAIDVPLLQLRDRTHGAIQGASIVAQLSVFDSHLCMARNQYEELGPQGLLARHNLWR